MDWHAEMEDERRMLKRIVALLFFFAWLARLSCALPTSARGYVLGVLYRAETRARGFVVDMAQDHGVTPPAFLLIPALQGGNTVADAIRFAQHFRALAVLLDHLIERYPCRQTRDIDTVPFAIGTSRAGNRLATFCRSLADATERQMRQTPMRLAFEPIDSS